MAIVNTLWSRGVSVGGISRSDLALILTGIVKRYEGKGSPAKVCFLCDVYFPVCLCVCVLGLQ